MKLLRRIHPVWGGLLALPVVLLLAFKVAIALTAFNPSEMPIGYVAQDEMTNYNLKSGKEVVFRGQYEREYWSGTLIAQRVSADGEPLSPTSWWAKDAGEAVNEQDFSTGRLIATMKDDGSTIAFRWDSLSAAQQGLLSSSILDYLRGDRSNEIPAAGKTMRQRVSVMGDVVHSRPYYVADATDPTLFVGANDGMLHAFNASCSSSEVGLGCDTTGDGGKERWAYVPSMLLPKMSKLTVSPYVHDYFVDGQINVATIASGSKRVLVGGLGAGGKGLYALDITGNAGLVAATEAAVASKIKWEITPTKVNYANPTTSNAYINLGYTFGTVTLAKVAGTDAVIVGNGYNDGLGSYAGCTHATPNYSNCGGDYQAYLYIINTDTGQLISAIKAGTSGTAASPNGLSTPAAIDSDGDGSVDTVYAGDLNGTMWKFNLTTATATALLTTSPAQPITSTPGVAVHPNGGYMINFATGKMLIPSDTTDTTTHYAYGVWDGAPLTNTTLQTQTLSNRDFVYKGVTTRVRRATSNAMNWASGGHLGWKVALLGGERVVGEGSFIENGRFYFTAYDPSVRTAIPSSDSVVAGEGFLMELNYLSGGSSNQPFLDLTGDVKLNNDDRIKYIATDTIPADKAVDDPIMSTDGIAVGKFISIGILSQPILVQLVTLNDTLFSQNPDIIVEPTVVDRGVKGGHFDVEIYYGTVTASTPATATITVGSSGQIAGLPATLGAIKVDGVTIVPPLTITDIVKGTATATNAQVITSKVSNGFSASRADSTVTITAPPGASYNGKTITIEDGTEAVTAAVPAVAGVRPTALVQFTGTTTGAFKINKTLGGGTRSVRLGANDAEGGDITVGINKTGIQAAAAMVSAMANGNTYKVYAYLGGNAITPLCAAQPTNVVCLVDTSLPNNADNNGNLVELGAITNGGGMVVTTTPSAGGTNGTAAIPASGYTNLKPALTTTAFAGAIEGTATGDTCANGFAKCAYKEHDHEYDDIYDRTGVNFLDASNNRYDLSRAVPSTSTEFKVLVQNQYLSPAVDLHIGNPAYLFNVNQGYVAIKNYQTQTTLTAATVLSEAPTYTRATIGSLAVNLPIDGFVSKDWWGGVNGLPADPRDGLHPTQADCVFRSADKKFDGNMYQPIIPPSTVTVTGNGTLGYSAASTQSTATGVRHNGALTIQIIKASTPASEVEQSVPDHPEYGWRVKAASYSTYVLAEYTIFHHTKHLPNAAGKVDSVCYGTAAWTKTPVADTRTCGTTETLTTKQCAVNKSAAGGTDPLIGNLGGNASVVSTVTTVTGDVTTTTITYSDQKFATIVRTVKGDGTVEIVTTDSSGAKTTEIIANKEGAIRSGGDERGLQARTGRISWRELVAP